MTGWWCFEREQMICSSSLKRQGLLDDQASSMRDLYLIKANDVAGWSAVSEQMQASAHLSLTAHEASLYQRAAPLTTVAGRWPGEDMQH